MTPTSTPVPPTGPRSNKKLLAGGALALGIGAFAYLLLGGIGENIVYFLTPEELLAKGTAAVERPVRLGGQVVPGSVQWDAEKLDLSFKVTGGTQEITVHSKGAPPQMFAPGIGVVVEGKWRKDGVFESDNLMVKHSEEYKAPEKGEQHPERIAKTLLREGEA
jgi:cytochrome c-type biogenesis protein CcmE